MNLHQYLPLFFDGHRDKEEPHHNLPYALPLLMPYRSLPYLNKAYTDLPIQSVCQCFSSLHMPTALML